MTIRKVFGVVLVLSLVGIGLGHFRAPAEAQEGSREPLVMPGASAGTSPAARASVVTLEIDSRFQKIGEFHAAMGQIKSALRALDMEISVKQHDLDRLKQMRITLCNQAEATANDGNRLLSEYQRLIEEGRLKPEPFPATSDIQQTKHESVTPKDILKKLDAMESRLSIMEGKMTAPAKSTTLVPKCPDDLW